jgi:hypothetical protein
MSEDLDSEVFRIIAYLVSSASNAPGETLTLASFRLLDAACRLVSLVESSDAFSNDPFLSNVREEFLQHFNEVMWDEPAFLRWLPQLERQVVLEARSRNLTEGVDSLGTVPE